MSTVAERMNAQARIVPLKPQNKVRSVLKTESGDLVVTLNSGDTFELDKDDSLFQAFVVYTVLADV